MLYLFTAFIIIINIIAFTAFMLDKIYAAKSKWRISEKTLLILAFAGGSIGSLISMYLFRHKIRKPVFYIGIPLILSVQLIIFICFLIKI